MKRMVTFEVDTSLLFDQLQAMQGDTSALGERLVSALLCQPSQLEQIGMAFYGVMLVMEPTSPAPGES